MSRSEMSVLPDLVATAATRGDRSMMVDVSTVRELLARVAALEAALGDIATMLPGSVPLPMTEEQYLRAMLHECVRKARAALAQPAPAVLLACPLCLHDEDHDEQTGCPSCGCGAPSASSSALAQPAPAEEEKP